MTPKDLILKVVSWRAVSVVSMLLTMWILTGDIQQSTGLTVIVQIVQMMVHGVFETIWEKTVASKGRSDEDR